MISTVWKQMGADTKNIHNQISSLVCCPEYQALLTKKETDQLMKALRYVDKFCILAEDRMATKIDNAVVSDKEFLSVFY